MSNITRYKIDVTHYRYISDARLREAYHGDVVKFEDHERIVKELTSKIAKLEKHIELLEYSVARGE